MNVVNGRRLDAQLTWTCAFGFPMRAVGGCPAWCGSVAAERQRHAVEPPDKAAPGPGAARHRATLTTTENHLGA